MGEHIDIVRHPIIACGNVGGFCPIDNIANAISSSQLSNKFKVVRAFLSVWVSMRFKEDSTVLKFR